MHKLLFLLVSLVCPLNGDLLVSKCCPSFEIVDIDPANPELKCIPAPEGHLWNPQFYSNDDLSPIEMQSYKVKFGFPACHYSILSDVFNLQEKAFILSNGGFLVNHRGTTNATFYCGDDFRFGERMGVGYLYCKEQVSDQELGFWKPVTVSKPHYPMKVPKCCPDGMSYDDNLVDCISDQNPVNPYFRDPQTGKVVFLRKDHDYLFYQQKSKFCPNDDQFPIGLEETSTDLQFHVLTSGDLYLPMLQKVIPQSHYCVDKMSSQTDMTDVYSGVREMIAFVCGSNLLQAESQAAEYCSTQVCIQKCCPQGQSFDLFTTFCQPSGKVFVPQFQDEAGTTILNPPPHNITPSVPLCNDPNTHLYTLDPKDPKDKFYLLKDGSLFLPSYKTTLVSSDFCLDHFFNSSKHEVDGSPIEYRVAPLLCFENCHFDPKVQCASGEERTTILYIHYVFISLIFVACLQ